MAESYLTKDGLLYVWQKLKTLFATKDVATTSANGLMSSTDKSKLNGIATGAEVNQNAFSNVQIPASVGTSMVTIAADTKTDTLTILPGSNVSITGDTSSDTLTISATNTTYSDATTSSHGLMTAADKTKLDGIAAGAEVNQNAFGTLGVVKGATSISMSASEESDAFTITQGDNITLTPHSANAPGVTISATNTTYSDFTGATSSAAGSHGLVPAPAAIGADTEPGVLRADGTWGTLHVSKIVGPTADTAFLVYLANTYAPKASPTLTGTPKAPTASAGTNNTQIATTAFVTTAVANAIAGVQGITYSIVTSLPSTGAAGTIYLIANSGSGQNIYDEYIWVNNKFEKIGTTETDLSGYLRTTDVVAITNAEIDTIFAS